MKNWDFFFIVTQNNTLCCGQIGRRVSTILFSTLVSLTREYYKNPLLREWWGEREIEMLTVEVLRMKVWRISVGFCCGKTHLSSTMSVEYISRPVFQNMPVFGVVLYKTRDIVFKTLICLFLGYSYTFLCHWGHITQFTMNQMEKD